MRRPLLCFGCPPPPPPVGPVVIELPPTPRHFRSKRAQEANGSSACEAEGPLSRPLPSAKQPQPQGGGGMSEAKNRFVYFQSASNLGPLS